MTVSLQDVPSIETVDGRVRAGDAFPFALLDDAHGHRQPVVDGPTVVVFHHGVASRSCHEALTTCRTGLLPALGEHDVRLVAVSTHRPSGPVQVARADALGFPVLVDEGGRLIHVLGLDVPGGGDAGGWALARPAVVVVDADQVVTLVDLRTGRTPGSATAAVLLAARGQTRP